MIVGNSGAAVLRLRGIGRGCVRAVILS